MAYSCLLLLNLCVVFNLGPCNVFAWRIVVIQCDFVVVNSLLDNGPIANGEIMFMDDVLCRPDKIQTHVRFITRWFMH